MVARDVFRTVSAAEADCGSRVRPNEGAKTRLNTKPAAAKYQVLNPPVYCLHQTLAITYPLLKSLVYSLDHIIIMK